MVMVEGEEERGEHGKYGRYQNFLFYGDDGMVSSSDPQWLQVAFSTLVGMFNRVSLRTHVSKIIDMVCCPCQAAGTQSEAAYRRWIMGEGPTYQERQKGQVQCRKYGEDMTAGSLAGHMITQNGRAEEDIWIWKTSAMG